MPSSFDYIDYSLRPAKHAERRMLAEVFARLRPFQPVEDYKYVGLGSVWFADFILFHRSLGISKMLSIERAVSAQARVEANKPFRSIEMEYKASSQVLPGLNWKDRHLVWLDYDDPIDTEMLLDARTIASNASSGSVLAISVQCHRAREDIEAEQNDDGESGLQRFESVFGRVRLGNNVMDDDLRGWRFGKLSRAIFYAEVEDALAKRNASLKPSDQLKFRPVCDFEYADGAKMTTLVGIFVSRSEVSNYDACGFGKLDFLPSTGRLVRIEVPILTPRELRHLEKQLPKKKSDPWQLGAIPAKQAERFAAFYRYFPNFVHSDP